MDWSDCKEVTEINNISNFKSLNKLDEQILTKVVCNYVLLKFKEKPQFVFNLLKHKSTLIPVSSQITASVTQAIGYNGMGKVTRLFNHVNDALGVVSNIQTRLNQEHLFRKSYWLARGDPFESTVGMSIVHYSRSELVALFFEYCLEKFTVSTLSGEKIDLQKKCVLNQFLFDKEIYSLVTNNDVQYLVACSLTKLLLINWQTLYGDCKSIASFSPSQTIPCLHQQFLLSLPTNEEILIGAANLMNYKINFKAILTTSLSNNKKKHIFDDFEFYKDSMYMTSICINQILDLQIDEETDCKIRESMSDLKVCY
ncbi:MAG: hypothetical protein ACQPRI_06135 [Solitalea-like symbiont of Tyrophagus putrescentiae]